jgi:hypothetical protein
MSRLPVLLLMMSWAYCMPLVAHAQSTTDATCTVRDHVPPAELGGDWQAEFWDLGGSPERLREQGQLRLERHPEYTAGVRGPLLRGSGGQMRSSQVSGDVSEGEFQLDESDDGKSISAVWSGQALDCAGRLVITGTRRPAAGVDAPDPVLSFRLQRFAGWR